MAFAPLVVRDGNGTAQNIQAFQDASSNSAQAVQLDSSVTTYRASANFAPQATAAVTLISIQGSATKTVRVKRILIGGVSTAVSQSILQLQRTSALGAGGTTVAPTIALLDRGPAAGNAAATAVVQHYTTTLKAAGTATNMGGPISTANVQTGVVTTPATLALGFLQPIFPEQSGQASGQSIVLRGTAEFLEVQNVTPTNLGAGTVYCYVIEWTEDAS